MDSSAIERWGLLLAFSLAVALNLISSNMQRVWENTRAELYRTELERQACQARKP
jgi:hypothetical protein